MPHHVTRLTLAAMLAVAAFACAQHTAEGPTPTPIPVPTRPAPVDCEAGLDFDRDGVALHCDELLELPPEMRPPGEPIYEYHLAAGGDTATAFIAGPCLGKVPGNCPAGAPVSVQGDRHASLRRAMMEQEARLSALVSEDGSTWYRQLVIASPERLVRLLGDDEQVLYEGQLSGQALYRSPMGGMFVRYVRDDGLVALDHWLGDTQETLITGAERVDVHSWSAGMDVEVKWPGSELRDLHRVRDTFPTEPSYADVAAARRFDLPTEGLSWTCIPGAVEGPTVILEERARGGAETVFVLAGATWCPGGFGPSFGDADSFVVAPTDSGNGVFRWRRGDARTTLLGEGFGDRPVLGMLGDTLYSVQESALWRWDAAGDRELVADGLEGSFHRLRSNGTHIAIVFGADINGNASVLVTDGEVVHRGEIPAEAAARAEGQWLSPEGRLFVVTRKDEGTLVSFADGEFIVHEGSFSYYGTTLEFHEGIGLLGTERSGGSGAMYRVDGATLTRLRDVGGRYGVLPGHTEGGLWVVYPSTTGDESGLFEVAVFDGESLDVRVERAEFSYVFDGSGRARVPVDAEGRPWLVYRQGATWSAAVLEGSELRVLHEGATRLSAIGATGGVDNAADAAWGLLVVYGDERDEMVQLCPFSEAESCASLRLAGGSLNRSAPIAITEAGRVFAMVSGPDSERDFLWMPRFH